MRVVVTGAAGFIGRHLVTVLAERGDIVQAWARPSRLADWNPPVEMVGVDITDRDAIRDQLARFSPGAIVHLAAQSLPGRSWEDPALTYEVNVLGAIHLLESIRRLKQAPRVLVAGSSAEYLEPRDGRPIVEGAPTEPNSPYASSKLAVDQLVQLYVHRYDLDLVRFRPFFVVGPGKTGDVCSDFARRIVAIERGQENTMRVGCLDVVRDIIDVRDGVSGILRLIDAAKRGEIYNVCCGKGVSIRKILETYRQLAAVPFNVVQDPALLRPLEQRVKIGESNKLRALGWKPEHNLDDTLHSILQYWRAIAP
jgi:GDP-4-dehydro-6-deoxy-D-mannose reductase